MLYGRLNEEYFDLCQQTWDRLLLGSVDVKSFPEVRKHKDFMEEPGLTLTLDIIEGRPATAK